MTEIEIKMVDGEKIRMNAMNYEWNPEQGILIVYSEDVSAYKSYNTIYNSNQIMYVSPVCALHNGGKMYDL